MAAFSPIDFNDLSGSNDNGGSSSLLASIFNDAASVASTAIATSNQPTINPALYNYGSGNVVAGAGLMFPHQGSSIGVLGILIIGVIAFVALKKFA